MQRRPQASTRFSGGAVQQQPAAAAAAGSSSSSSGMTGERVPGSVKEGFPSWLCLTLSYFVLLLHLSSSYLVLQGAPTHIATLQAVLLAVNVVHILAFRSLALQVDGLLAPRTGLLPLDRQEQLQKLQQLPASVPASFILSAVSSIAKHMSKKTQAFQLSHLAWAGAGAAAFNICVSLLLPAGPSRAVWETACCCCQFLLYLSFRFFGREFLAFQWDVLLLECSFICCFGPVALALGNHFAVSAVVLMLRLLLFKLLFSSAVSKCSAAAPHWRDLKALNFHYWTQPLPCAGSWYAYWSRGKQLQAGAVLFIEGVMSFCIFGPPFLRTLGLLAIMGLAAGVLLTGNVGFLPHLTAAISMALLDDSLLGVAAPKPVSLKCASMAGALLIGGLVGVTFLVSSLGSSNNENGRNSSSRRQHECLLLPHHLEILLLVLSSQLYSAACLHYFCKMWLRPGLAAPSWAFALCKELSLIGACNAYGLFSVVTTGRFEVVLEELHSTADDKPQWLEVFCAYKPGDVNSSPPWLWSGHFPRLDWRMWFIPLRLRSALGDAIRGRQNHLLMQHQQAGRPDLYGAGSDTTSPLYPPFWNAFLEQLCSRQPAILQLLGPQGEALKGLPPPKSLRISLYDYRMAPPEGLPLYAAFFPEGWDHLSQQEVLKLEDEVGHWTVGRWWLRRHHQTIDLLNFTGGRPLPAEDALN